MTPTDGPEQPVSHQMLLDRIITHEGVVRGWMHRLLIVGLPVLGSSFVWAWQGRVEQESFNADMSARVQSTTTTYAELREAQRRIEERQDEIYRFLREDSRELRETLRQHTDGQQKHSSGGK